jgi:hypothetical protein
VIAGARERLGAAAASKQGGTAGFGSSLTDTKIVVNQEKP